MAKKKTTPTEKVTSKPKAITKGKAASPLTNQLKASIEHEKVRNSECGPPHVIVTARAGCLSGDTIIHLNRARKGFQADIRTVVAQFNGNKPSFTRTYTMRGKIVESTQKFKGWDLAIPTQVARADGGVIKLGLLKAAWCSGEKETFTVTTNSGKSIRATADHPFMMSDGGWRELQHLDIGSLVCINSGRGTAERSKKTYYRYTPTRFHPNQIYAKRGGVGKLNGYGVPEHRAIMEAHQNGLSFCEFLKIVNYDEERAETLHYLSRKQIVHHINGNTRDNTLSNLQILADTKAHSEEHEWGDHVLWQVGIEEVASVDFYGVESVYDLEIDNHPHNFIANEFVVHNCGKTTTLVEGLKRIKRIPSTIVPSPQQEAVWNQMELSRDAKSICMVAFNKSIAEELQRRVPPGCDASTLHSMGMKIVGKVFKLRQPGAVNSYRVNDIIAEIKGRDSRDLYREKPVMVNATQKLVSLCKMNLTRFGGLADDYGADMNALEDLASYYDIDLNGSRNEVFDLVPKVLERCKDVGRDYCIDYDDMIWLPVILDLPTYKYDLLLCDEAQDLNRCQQALVKRAGNRLIFVGDPKQAVYGFAGADCDSMPRMARELSNKCTDCHDAESTAQCCTCKGTGTFLDQRGCVVLPLTVTRRCGKAIVKEANRLVPDFEAHESNSEGKISHARYDAPEKTGGQGPCPKCKGIGKTTREVNDGDGHLDVWEEPCEECGGTGYTTLAKQTSYHERVNDGDMVLCRCNAPLVSNCFKFLKAGRKANIQGRDIGQGLISTIKKLKAVGVEDLVLKITDWLNKEVAKENAKRNPNEHRIIAVQDRADCIICFTEDVKTVDAVVKKIEAVFTDNKESPGIRLSSVHKSKGLEASAVFLLQPKGCSMPHPMARTAWQMEQEWNLKYVALTRAINELIYVS